MSTLIQELEKDNLCTYFVLPLLKLNKSSFALSNFIDSYISYGCREVIVRVYDTTLVSRKVFIHPDYVSTVSRDEEYYFTFKVPEQWLNDVRLYRQGLYSRMSEKAKDTIRQWSGLPYLQSGEKRSRNTDFRLLALTRHKVLKDALEAELGYEYGKGEELLFGPREKSFIKL